MAIDLPPPRTWGEMFLEQAIARRRSVRAFSQDPLALGEVGQLLWAAQGMTGPRGERAAPSAGAIHPLSLRLVAARVDGLAAGVYRHEPKGHRLVAVAEGDRLGDIAAAALAQEFIGTAAALVAVVARPASTEARYGRRARRYVMMEAGHAAQNLLLQATALGLGATPVGAFDDRRLAEILSLGPGEEVLCLLPVGRPG